MKARPVKKLDPQGPLLENAARILRVRTRELRSFAPVALHPERSVEQHDMRIAAKRLRYVLETTEFCFGAPAAGARRAAKQLQDVLGELHDCDVMAPRIAAHAAELRDRDADAVRERAGDAGDLDPALAARAPHRTSYRGLGVLSVHVEARRRLLFDRFVALWHHHERAGTWKRLNRAIERKLAEAPKHSPRAAAELADARRVQGGDGRQPVGPGPGPQ